MRRILDVYDSNLSSSYEPQLRDRLQEVFHMLSCVVIVLTMGYYLLSGLEITIETMPDVMATLNDFYPDMGIDNVQCFMSAHFVKP